MASTIPNISEIKGNLFVSASVDSTNLGNGSIASSGTLFVDSINSFTDSVGINLLNTLESTSSASGSLVLSGGLGIAKKLFIGGTTTAQAGIVIPSSNILELGGGVTKEENAGKIVYQGFSSGLDIVGAGTSSGNRILTLWDNVNIINNLSVPGITTITNTTASTSTTTGALIVSGGAGIVGELYSNSLNSGATSITSLTNTGVSSLQGTVVISNTNNISATDNGALGVLGGVKILKDLYSNTISLPPITAPVNTNGVKFYVDTEDGKFKSINGSSQVTTYNPTTLKGDLIVNNGSDLVRLPAGNYKDVLIPDPADSRGIRWINIFDTNVDLIVFGTQYNSLAVPARQTTTSTAFQTAATFNIPAVPAGSYKISYYYEKYINSRAMVVIIQLDGVTIFQDNTEVTGVATALGVEGSTPTSGITRRTLTAGTHTILVRYASTTGLLSREANIQNIYLEIFRLT